MKNLLTFKKWGSATPEAVFPPSSNPRGGFYRKDKKGPGKLQVTVLDGVEAENNRDGISYSITEKYRSGGSRGFPLKRGLQGSHSQRVLMILYFYVHSSCVTSYLYGKGR